MRRHVGRSAALASLLALVAVGAACGEDDGNGSARGTSRALPDGGTEPVVEGGATPDALPPPVPFSIVDEPDPGCVVRTTAVPMTLALPTGLTLTGLEAVGARRVARDASGRGFVVFGADGQVVTSAAVSVGDDTRAAASDSGITAVGRSTSNEVVFQRFDLDANPLGPAAPLGFTKVGRVIGVARRGPTSLVVFTTADDAIVARIIAEDGVPGPAIELLPSTPIGDISIAITSTAEDGPARFAVFFAGYRDDLASYRVYSARIGAAAAVGSTRIVFASDVAIRVAYAASHEAGLVLLANLEGSPLVVPLDAVGRTVGAARRFAGARDVVAGGGHGLVVTPTDITFLAPHESGAHALRRLDRLGVPREGWVCLDGPSPEEAQLGGLAADGSGYAAVLSGPGETSRYVRVDATGAAPLP